MLGLDVYEKFTLSVGLPETSLKFHNTEAHSSWYNDIIII